MLQKLIRFRRSGKGAAIRMLMGKFPQRRFVFVGDSGEKDLEIYRKLAGKFPDQVLAILIRNLSEHPLEQERLDRNRAGLSGVPINCFETAEELQAQVAPLLAGELAAAR